MCGGVFGASCLYCGITSPLRDIIWKRRRHGRVKTRRTEITAVVESTQFAASPFTPSTSTFCSFFLLFRERYHVVHANCIIATWHKQVSPPPYRPLSHRARVPFIWYLFFFLIPPSPPSRAPLASHAPKSFQMHEPSVLIEGTLMQMCFQLSLRYSTKSGNIETAFLFHWFKWEFISWL